MSRFLLLLLTLFAFGTSLAQPSSAQAESSNDLSERRARIERMSPEERAQIMARYRELERLPTERREKLFSRCEKLKQRDRRMERDPGFKRFRKHAESGEHGRQRDRRFGKRAFDYRRKLAARIEALLPEGVRTALKSAADHRARREILRPHRRLMNEARFLVEASDLLKIESGRARRILGLPDEQRAAELRTLHRDLIEWGVKEHGLGKVRQAVWAKLRDEPDARVFLEGVRRLDLPIRKFGLPSPLGFSRGRGRGPRGPGGPDGMHGPEGRRGPGGPPDGRRGFREHGERPPLGGRPERREDRRQDRRSDRKERQGGTDGPKS